jgi:Ser/Thr protein kinase RdoA (MazF antagonist)
MEELFKLYGWEVLGHEPIHQGLINSTYSIQTTTGEFIFQSINHNVFKTPKAIDNNINAISAYIKKHQENYLFTHLVPTQNGKTLIEWEGGYYRAFHKLEGYALSVLDNEHQVEEAAKQFAQFTLVLKHFDVNALQDTLPQFHDLNLRYHQFTEAIQNGDAKRIAATQEAIGFLKAHKNLVAIYDNFIHHQEVKKRVTHHDTKISNVLFDNQDKGLCVIDLDTVMPGYFISDVGDMLRTYLCPVSEEEKDFSKIIVRDEFYKAIINGYKEEMLYFR